MAKVLSSCEVLNLEKKNINEDPNLVAFASLAPKAATIIDKLDCKDAKNNNIEGEKSKRAKARSNNII